ncbi:hypothetical protein DXG01_009410 [Tephrocybe rancida]|nr:hypothetical protein DXG01_009410 [Tephrocybe rancida]
MVDRFLGGLLHAMTHVGYGLEFGLVGMVVEGLAQAAVHDDMTCAGIPDGFFFPGKLEELQSKSVHAITVPARVLHHPDFQTIRDTSEEATYGWTRQTHGASIMKHMTDWTFDASDPREVERKAEELCWGNTVLFGHAPRHLTPLPPLLYQTPNGPLPSHRECGRYRGRGEAGWDAVFKGCAVGGGRTDSRIGNGRDRGSMAVLLVTDKSS